MLLGGNQKKLTVILHNYLRDYFLQILFFLQLRKNLSKWKRIRRIRKKLISFTSFFMILVSIHSVQKTKRESYFFR